MGSASAEVVTLLHFNDVYNIEGRKAEPRGGAARFVTALRRRQHLNPMVFFSGDAFSPSMMSTIVKGKQMVPILNGMNITCACYGNHDFDFGVSALEEMAEQCNFPWLLSNVIDNLDDKPLAKGIISKIIPWQGIKFGLLGLVEEEWIATLSTIDPDDITFFDFVEEGRALAQELREQGADYIIALTHMRWPNDRRLAENVDEIDLILGGHDHDYNVEQVNGKYVIKSGTDFRELSQVTLTFSEDRKHVDVHVEKVVVDSSVEEEPEMKAIVHEYMDQLGAHMDNVIGNIDVDLDGKFKTVRTAESNLGNLITDVMRQCTHADVALLNSGTLRSDTLHPCGPFRVRDLMAILPIGDSMVVLKCQGRDLHAALENGVSQWPKLEGRFPQVSGFTFAFDPEAPPGSRVDPSLVRIRGEVLNMDEYYRLATKNYLRNGKDGYECLKTAEVLQGEEECPVLSNAVLNHFKTVSDLRAVQAEAEESSPSQAMSKHWRVIKHHQAIISLSKKARLVRQLGDAVDGPVVPRAEPTAMATPPPAGGRPVLTRKTSITSPGATRVALLRRESIQSVELESIQRAVAPQLEGRIVVLDAQKKRELEEQKMCDDVMKTVIREDTLESAEAE